MVLTAYPVAGKQKSFDICLAFSRAAGGQIAGAKLRPGAAFFYGVDKSNAEVWRQVVAGGQEFFYSDNSYFDATRQHHFRVTRNALQHSGRGESDGKRFAALGIEIKPWRAGGDYILLCPQSEHFMHTVVGENGSWVPRTIAALQRITDRPIKVRHWSANKAIQSASLAQDLEHAHSVVTWSSAAAVSAVLAGVPVVTMGQCAAEPMAGALKDIENLPRSDDRLGWANVLADQQWSMEEIRNGTAWRALNG